MADTIQDITAPSDDWVNVYSETSISVGTAVRLSNKSAYPILLHVSSSKPSASSKDGEILDPQGVYSRLEVSAGESGLWAKCTHSDIALGAKMSVQEV